MSHSLSFETVDVNGKPAIFFHQVDRRTSRHNKETVDYRTRDQKFPLRSINTVVVPSTHHQSTFRPAQPTSFDDNNMSLLSQRQRAAAAGAGTTKRGGFGPDTAESASNSARRHRQSTLSRPEGRPPPAMVTSKPSSGRTRRRGEDVVTLTQSQLAAILESVSRIANPHANTLLSQSTTTAHANDIKIKIDKQGNKVNIEAISPRIGDFDRLIDTQQQQQDYNFDRNNHIASTHQRASRPNMDRSSRDAPMNGRGAAPPGSRRAPPPGSKQQQSSENFMSLLTKANASNNQSNNAYRRQFEREDVPANHVAGRRHYSPETRAAAEERFRPVDREEEEDDSEVDSLMKRIIMENKDKMSEEELVNLLSRVYMKSQNGRGDQRNAVLEKEALAGYPQRRSSSPSSSNAMDDLRAKHRDAPPPRPAQLMNEKPTAPLTMGEKKRMQWDLERAELENLQRNQNSWQTTQGRQQSAEVFRRMKSEKSSQSMSDLLGGVGLDESNLPQSRFTSNSQTLVEANRRKRESAEKEQQPRGMAPGMQWGNEDDRKRQDEIARKRWVAELDAQRNERQQSSQRKGVHANNTYAMQQQRVTSPVSSGMELPQHRRGRGLADLAGKQSNSLFGNDKPPQAPPVGTRGRDMKSQNQTTPPWLR